MVLLPAYTIYRCKCNKISTPDASWMKPNIILIDKTHIFRWQCFHPDHEVGNVRIWTLSMISEVPVIGNKNVLRKETTITCLNTMTLLCVILSKQYAITRLTKMFSVVGNKFVLLHIRLWKQKCEFTNVHFHTMALQHHLW